MLPEFLAPVDVGDMGLDGRDARRGDSIAERNARVRISTGIDNDRLVLAHGVLDLLHQLAFMVRLEEGHLDTEFSGERGESPLDVVEREVSIDIRLSFSEQIQVWSMYHEYLQEDPLQNKKLPEAVSDAVQIEKTLQSELFEQLGDRHSEEESPLAEVPSRLYDKHEKILVVEPPQHDHGLISDDRDFIRGT